MKCPSCFGMLESDGTCSCGYGKNKVVPIRESAPILCAWVDQGRPCPCRGIMSEGTAGNGSWYCREHWDRLNRREPLVRGNAMTKPPESLAANKWREDWRAKFGDRKVVQDKPLPNPLEAA